MFTIKKWFSVFVIVFTTALFLFTNGHAQDDSDSGNPNYSDSDSGITDGYYWALSIEAQTWKVEQYDNYLIITFRGGATLENYMNNPDIQGDGQTVWLNIYINDQEFRTWSRDIEDYYSYQTVYLKDDNSGSSEYVCTDYNNSNSSENVQVKFKIRSFVCVGGTNTTEIEKTYTSKVFTLPRKDPLIYIAKSQVDFGAGSGSETKYHAFTVENHGADPLYWTAEETERWLSISDYHGTGEKHIDVTVNRNNILQDQLQYADHFGTISFTTQHPNGGEESVTVNASIVAPSTPQNLIISNAGSYNQSPHLTWDAVDLVYRYKIFRRPYIAVGEWQQIGTASSTGYTDYEVVMTDENDADDQFYYKVKASNGAGDSGYSNLAFTWGFTMHKANPDGHFTQLELKPELANEYKLENSYPNPGNPGTTIKFQLPEAVLVSLKVVNVRGEVVRTLIDREIAAGVHEVYWDGYNDQGTVAGTGLYIFVLRAGGKVFHKKYSLVK